MRTRHRVEVVAFSQRLLASEGLARTTLQPEVWPFGLEFHPSVATVFQRFELCYHEN